MGAVKNRGELWFSSKVSLAKISLGNTRVCFRVFEGATCKPPSSFRTAAGMRANLLCRNSSRPNMVTVEETPQIGLDRFFANMFSDTWCGINVISCVMLRSASAVSWKDQSVPALTPLRCASTRRIAGNIRAYAITHPFPNCFRDRVVG